MKILYIANEFRDVQIAARALRSISPHVTVLWGSSADRAAFWIRENPDLAALIVEVQFDSQGCAFLQHARSLGLHAPIVVVLPEGAAPPRESLEAGADDYLAKDQSFSRELPIVVTRTIERAQDVSAAWDHLRSETVLADAVGITSTTERRLGNFESSLHGREHSWAVEQSAVSERQQELEELVHREPARRTDLEQKLTHSMAALQDAERREAELKSMLTEAAATRHTLERRMADTEAALGAANERLSRERLVAVEQASVRQTEFQAQLDQEVESRRSVEELLARAEIARADAERRHAEREAELDGLIRQERETRALVEQKLVHFEATWRDAEQQHASAMTIATTRLAERQAHFETELSQTAATRDDLRQRLSDVQAVFEEARRDHGLAATEVERLTRREAELTSMLTEAAATHHTLERRMADIEAALEAANERLSRERLVAAEQTTERHTEFQTQLEQEVERRRSVEELLARAETAVTTAATLLAERQAQFDAELAEATTARNTLGQQAHDLEAALGGTQQTLASYAAEVERLRRREAELTSTLAEATTIRNTLEDRLADIETAFKDADERTTQNRMAAAERAAEREADLDELIRQERVTRALVEQKLAHVEAAWRDAEQQHASAMTSAVTTLAERQAQFESELSQTTAARDDLRQRLSDVQAALEEARHDHGLAATEVERLAQREAELTSLLTEAATTLNSLERRVTDTEAALGAANERLLRDRLVAVEQATERQTEFQAQLEQEFERRRTVEELLARAETTRDEAEKRHAERQAQFESELSQTTATRDDLRQRLSDVEADLEHSRRLEIEHREELDSLERGRLAAEAEVRRLAAEHTEAERNLEEARKDFQNTLDLVSSEYADAQAKLVASVSERDAQLEEQAARHSASLQAVEYDRSQLQDSFETTVAARDREIEQLRGSLKAAIQELVGARTRCEALQTELPQLQRQLDESRLETRRQFHRTPLALGRCTRDGALTHANRAFADLVGYRKPDELPGTDFAKTVFESPDDLSWLIERCLSTHARVSVETAWTRTNGERVVVRLSALESPPDLIEIAAEDITNLRALQDRLGQAHRMEAVGRLASEIAVTCGNLLRDIHQDAQQWLATVSDDAALRQRGERLLDEVTRAAGFLQQLSAYGDEQTSALESVDLNKVLRDLKPVLKQVAGDEVALELPKISSPLHVDVKAERVERLLVNLASYGRERMPSGGRLKFEVATVVVGQRFIEQYPSVRQGAHALVTVTEVRRTTGAEGSLQLVNHATTPDAGEVASEKPGVDLGALQELIRECGGHLWMTVEPPGNMVVKIHLPLRSSDDQAHAHTSDTRSRIGRAAARLFGR